MADQQPTDAREQDSSEDETDRRKLNPSINARPLDETIAGTGPGIPDDALAPGEDRPEAPTDDEVRAAAEKLGAPLPRSGNAGGQDGE